MLRISYPSNLQTIFFKGFYFLSLFCQSIVRTVLQISNLFFGWCNTVHYYVVRTHPAFDLLKSSSLLLYYSLPTFFEGKTALKMSYVYVCIPSWFLWYMSLLHRYIVLDYMYLLNNGICIRNKPSSLSEIMWNIYIKQALTDAKHSRLSRLF